MREPIACVWFTDRWRRAVYEEPDGRQFVHDYDDGEKLYGVWYIPPEECVVPVIVDVPSRSEDCSSSAPHGLADRAIW